jgi:RNA polymerase sigma-70 factor (ECF subfamily)
MKSVAHVISTELDELTLARAVRGEDDACRALVEMYQARVFALVSRMAAGRGRATIEDLAQDTFLAVFRKLPTFRHDGAAQLSTWILTIAARRAIDELRRRRPEPVAEPIVAVTRASEVARAIESALAELSPELRAAFVLRELHGLDYDEISRALAIEVGTVKSRLSRARAALRARLAEVHDGK